MWKWSYDRRSGDWRLGFYRGGSMVGYTATMRLQGVRVLGHPGIAAQMLNADRSGYVVTSGKDDISRMHNELVRHLKAHAVIEEGDVVDPSLPSFEAEEQVIKEAERLAEDDSSFKESLVV